PRSVPARYGCAAPGCGEHRRRSRDGDAGSRRKWPPAEDLERSLILVPTSIAFSICAGVNTPAHCAISNAVTPAMIVGTWKAPLAMNSSSERASRKLPSRLNRPRFKRINPTSAERMCGDAPAQAMGRFDDRADFIIGELLIESSLDAGEHPAS